MAETPWQNISTVQGIGRSRRQHFGRLKPMCLLPAKIPITKTHSPRTEFVPKIMLTNVMSLVPKLDELRILDELRESVCDTHATVHGVCMYIKNSIRFKRLPEIEHSDFEVLWTHIRPPRLPRGINGIVSTCVYPPPSSSNTDLFQYLSDSLTLLENLFPGVELLLLVILTTLTLKIFAEIFS